METNNESAGRFGRIEHKIDSLSDDLGDFRVAVEGRFTALETRVGISKEQDAARVSDRSYTMMKLGVLLSVGVGVASVVARFL